MESRHIDRKLEKRGLVNPLLIGRGGSSTSAVMLRACRICSYFSLRFGHPLPLYVSSAGLFRVADAVIVKKNSNICFGRTHPLVDARVGVCSWKDTHDIQAEEGNAYRYVIVIPWKRAEEVSEQAPHNKNYPQKHPYFVCGNPHRIPLRVSRHRIREHPPQQPPCSLLGERDDEVSIIIPR